MSIKKQRRPQVAPFYKSKEDASATKIRGLVMNNGGSYINTTTSEATHTVSLGSVVGTNAVAVLLKVRIQDTSAASFVRVAPKTEVDSGQRSAFRLFANANSVPSEGQCIIPVNSDREVMYQVSDAEASAVQTASMQIVGYFI